VSYEDTKHWAEPMFAHEGGTVSSIGCKNYNLFCCELVWVMRSINAPMDGASTGRTAPLGTERWRLAPSVVRVQSVETEAEIDRRRRRFIALVGELLDNGAVGSSPWRCFA
jgi:hypothetical protein